MSEKIKNRIKALLSKTVENGASKEEMQSALKKASDLMIENFISENDLKDESIIEQCILKSVPLIKSSYDLSLFYSRLAYLFDCKYYFTNYEIVFFGHSNDVEFCEYFYHMIIKSCLFEKNKYMKSEKFKQQKISHHGKTLASSFIKGFLIEVCIKIQEIYEDRERNIPQSYGLMVIDKKDKVKNEFENLNMKLRTLKPKPLRGVQNAFDAGKEKGKEFRLSQGISAKNEQSGRFIE